MFRIILAVCFTFSLSVVCAAGTQFPFNGVLADPVKGKVLNGTFNLQFTAYYSETGGEPVGTTIFVSGQVIKKGAYFANLDFGANVFDGSPVWIEVSYQNAKKPAGFVATSPRIRVATVPYAQMADYATTSGYSVESLMSSHATTADSATNAGYANHAMVADSLTFPINAVPGNASAYVIVKTTADPATNGENLHQAYAAAKALTPNGQPLSATNRASLIVVPGKYYLYAPLTLDAEFVDLIGLTTNRANQHLYGRTDAAATATLAQTANNVRIENLAIELNRAPGSFSIEPNSPAAYFPGTDRAQTVVNNCEFSGSLYAWSTRIGIVHSGTFINCTGGSYSFGGNSTASGTFINCIGGLNSFGYNGFASGTFTNCTGGNFSFGSYGIVSGIFKGCTGGSNSFGYNANATGGRLYHCIGGGNSFTTTGNPTVIGCVRNGVAYP